MHCWHLGLLLQFAAAYSDSRQEGRPRRLDPFAVFLSPAGPVFPIARERPRVTEPVLVAHDPGCRYARPEGGGHTDAAKRLSDTYNLHRAVLGLAGAGVMAISLADGTSDGQLYPDRETAVAHQHHNERWFAYIRLQAPSMSVCEAESVMRWQRQANKLAPAQLGEKNGGLEVIPRLNLEDQERQIAALSGRARLPIALGRSDPR